MIILLIAAALNHESLHGQPEVITPCLHTYIWSPPIDTNPERALQLLGSGMTQDLLHFCDVRPLRCIKAGLITSREWKCRPLPPLSMWGAGRTRQWPLALCTLPLHFPGPVCIWDRQVSFSFLSHFITTTAAHHLPPFASPTPFNCAPGGVYGQADRMFSPPGDQSLPSLSQCATGGFDLFTSSTVKHRRRMLGRDYSGGAGRSAAAAAAAKDTGSLLIPLRLLHQDLKPLYFLNDEPSSPRVRMRSVVLLDFAPNKRLHVCLEQLQSSVACSTFHCIILWSSVWK